MAKATKVTTKKEVVKLIEEEALQLTLTMEETHTLHTILNSIGGSTTNSPRMYADTILNAIQEALNVDYHCCCKYENLINKIDKGAIYFKSFEEKI